MYAADMSSEIDKGKQNRIMMDQQKWHILYHSISLWFTFRVQSRFFIQYRKRIIEIDADAYIYPLYFRYNITTVEFGKFQFDWNTILCNNWNTQQHLFSFVGWVLLFYKSYTVKSFTVSLSSSYRVWEGGLGEIGKNFIYKWGCLR